MAPVVRRRAIRWVVPVAILAAFGLIAFVPTLSSASPPDLPPLTAQQLIEKVQQSNVEAFSGTFALTTDLGIPDLGSLQQQDEHGGGFNPLDLLSGTHSVDIKADGPERQNVVMRGDLTESSVWHNGRDVWTWQSEGQEVTHVILPEHKEDVSGAPEPTAGEPVPTPQELAKQFLDEVSPSTNVSVTTPDYVADRPVYSLVLAPKSADSTVDHVAMAVDAANGVPLEVGVWAKGKEKPALKLGFTSISFARPSGPFTFDPPARANVTTKDLAKEKAEHEGRRTAEGATPEHHDQHAQHERATAGGADREPITVGDDWSTVVIFPGVELPAPGSEEGRLLDQMTTSVSGSFGSGRLLHTNLINALILPSGTVVTGFVTPQVLESSIRVAG